MKYCESIYQTKRLKTRIVSVGNVAIGGQNPIRIQSMTTTPTSDVDATLEQVMRLADAGCEIVRVTVQGMKEAAACEEIKSHLVQKGVNIPLVADIHFYPPAAMHVVDFVDKVRINPGNFADRRATFRLKEYDEKSYQYELDKIEEKFAPLVQKSKKLGKALRIGTNHGSLSDRIMNRYGDTPAGMVESALEFARVARKYDFHNFLFSMKASNPLVMIHAYRLLAKEMLEMGWDYPLHLGVTEAGEGEDGRIKSAVGIGALLLDGLGDTIRVSLTEDPWEEIDPCKRLVALAEKERGVAPFEETTRYFTSLEKRPVDRPLHPNGAVILAEKPKGETQADAFIEELDSFVFKSGENFDRILIEKPEAIFFRPTHSPLHEGRHLFDWLKKKELDIPVYLHFFYNCSSENFVIEAAAECGALLTDHLGEGISLTGDYPPQFLEKFSFQLLQACRMRTTKTEFISCPGCGRTLFDLQEVSKRIREKTAHLPGVKIAIMGCIVNGPGEMADADFGYVGSKAGKIDLYVGKTCVERNIDHIDADERLIALIKTHGKWIDEPILHKLPIDSL